MRTLIVGTGRSGTKWIVETLNSQGINSAHQLIRHAHVLGEPFDWPEDVEVIVSFEAVPIMCQIEARRLLVIRHPDDTIGSWLKMGAFGDLMRSEYAMWSAVLDRWFPAVLQEATPQDRAAHYWIVWNLHAAMYCDGQTRLDEITHTGWFDVKWEPPATTSFHMPTRLRPALRSTIDRMWTML